MAVSAPATLRITDGRPVKADAPTAKSRAFQLPTKEARAAPNVVAGTCLLSSTLIMLYDLCVLYSCIGTFLANGMSTHVLFDSGATRSFVPLALSKKFGDAPGTLDSLLEVEIADDHTFSVVRVYQGCVLNVLGERFRVDLVPISLRRLKVIVGMDWLGANGAMIDCERHLVRIRTQNGGELVIHGERASRGPTLCSAARYRRFLQQVCTGFLAYVSDSRVKTIMDVGSVPMVQDFRDVFPEELPGMPPERQVEFRIDLVSGAAPIAKAPYRLAPPEMQELSTQLQELLDQGFIRPSSSSWGAPIHFMKKKDV